MIPHSRKKAPKANEMGNGCRLVPYVLVQDRPRFLWFRPCRILRCLPVAVAVVAGCCIGLPVGVSEHWCSTERPSAIQARMRSVRNVGHYRVLPVSAITRSWWVRHRQRHLRQWSSAGSDRAALRHLRIARRKPLCSIPPSTVPVDRPASCGGFRGRIA